MKLLKVLTALLFISSVSHVRAEDGWSDDYASEPTEEVMMDDAPMTDDYAEEEAPAPEPKKVEKKAQKAKAESKQKKVAKKQKAKKTDGKAKGKAKARSKQSM